MRTSKGTPGRYALALIPPVLMAAVLAAAALSPRPQESPAVAPSPVAAPAAAAPAPPAPRGSPRGDAAARAVWVQETGRGAGAGGTPEVLRVLRDDPSPVVRETAAWTLAAGEGDDPALEPALEDAYAREIEPAVRVAIAAASGRRGLAGSEEFLLTVLRGSPDADVRRAAADGLAFSGTAEALDDLAEIEPVEPDPLVRMSIGEARAHIAGTLHAADIGGCTDHPMEEPR